MALKLVYPLKGMTYFTLAGSACFVMINRQDLIVSNDVSNFTGQFSTTRWSVVLLAGQEASPESAAALEKLCRAYWQPICLFARRRGWNEEDAKDLTQQFFARLLARNDFHGLDPGKGKFRTFLLAAFTHFLANARDHAAALKRGGGKVVSLDEISSGEIAELPLAPELPPAALYDLHWAKTVLQTALRRLQEEMLQAGKQVQFGELKPFLTANASAGEYAAVAVRLGMETSSVPVLVYRLRQRYRDLARNEVAQTVTTPAELEEEMRYLFAVLNR